MQTLYHLGIVLRGEGKMVLSAPILTSNQKHFALTL